MTVPQPVDAPIEGLAESASLGAVNCLGVIELAPSIKPGCGGIFSPSALKPIADVAVKTCSRNGILRWKPRKAASMTVHQTSSQHLISRKVWTIQGYY